MEQLYAKNIFSYILKNALCKVHAVNRQYMHQTQSGVALIMVLGMVAVIAAWASTAMYEDLISIRRIANIQEETRATMASESAYALTLLYLEEDQKLTNNLDTLEEDWAFELPPFPIDEGLIAVEIEDANRFFNLNDLVNDQGTVQSKHVEQLQRLFSYIGLDRYLVDALVDWMDKGDVPYGAGGAEDSAYYDKDYKIKNARLDNWSELKLIIGFDNDVLKKLATVATVRPSKNQGKTLININTAAPFVLMALFPKMNQDDEEVFFENRPYEDKNVINEQTWKTGGDIPRLSVYSDAFMLRTHALFGKADVREEFLLSRNGSQIKLISRERRGWQF